MKKITAVIPCYNEAEGIGSLLRSFPRDALAKQGYELDVLVVDNNSTDETAAIAQALGATVIHEAKKGKGNAIRAGFYHLKDDTDYVVMLDGDDTYKAKEILRLIEPLDSGFCDVIIGSRLGGKIRAGSMSAFNMLGNWGFSFLVRALYHVNVTDTLTGYFAWKREVIVELRKHIVSSGFAIEMEMITKMARLGYNIYSVPISYEPRLGESSLRPITDGFRILRELLRQLHWAPNRERVAFVSDTVYPFNKGGKEKRLHEITRRMVKEGREVDIYTMKWWQDPEKVIVQDGVRLHAISKLYPLYNGERRSIKEAILFSLACFKLFRVRFDVLDVDSMPFFPIFVCRIVSWCKRKRMMATWHEVWGRSYWQSYMKFGSVGAFLEWLAIKLPDTIISNSDHTTRQLEASGKHRPVITVPLGVDVEAIKAIPPHFLQSDIIYAGRLLDHKNVHLLIEALSLVRADRPELSCIIVGDGPERERLQAQVRQLGLDEAVTFLSFLENQDELYGLMKSSKLLVLPSVREGFGLIVLEANACGIPVITTSHAQNAAKDLIITGKNGELAEANARDLAMRIEHVLRSQTLQPQLALRQDFGTYRWTNAAEAVEKALTAR